MQGGNQLEVAACGGLAPPQIITFPIVRTNKIPNPYRKDWEIHAKFEDAYRKATKQPRGQSAQIAWADRNPRQRILWRAKHSAKKKNLDFSLTLDDIIIPQICPYLGVVLTTGYQGRDDCRASIDRKDSTKGYIKGNIQIISQLANKMKSNANTEQLIKFAKSILKMENQ